MTTARALAAKALSRESFSRSEILALLALPEASPLFQAADWVRQQRVGDEVHLRALIEISNYCKNDCLYCGIRRSNVCASRYRLEPEQIVRMAQLAVESGYKTVVLQGGEDPWFTSDKIAPVISHIKELGAAVTLSLGEKSREEYAAYRQAGADRYLLRIETTDKTLYEKLDPDMNWDNRVRCLYDLKELGYEVGSGSLVGLPGQTRESLADDLLFFKELEIDMAGIGPFIPHPQTPLAQAQVNGHLALSLKMMAIMRLMLPDINIPATTAMEALHPDGRFMALQSGANVIMPNVTLEEYRQKYELYPGKPTAGMPGTYRTELQAKLKNIGRTAGKGCGTSRSYLNHKK